VDIFDKWLKNQYIIYMEIEAFWKRVKLLLKEKNLIQLEAARACGRSLFTLRGWMAKGINPPLCDAWKIAGLLGVSLEYLISGRITDKTVKANREVLILLKRASEKLNRAV